MAVDPCRLLMCVLGIPAGYMSGGAIARGHHLSELIEYETSTILNRSNL